MKAKETSGRHAVPADLYRAACEYAPTGIIMMDVDAQVQVANRRAADMLQVTEDELVGRDFRRFVVPDERELFDRCLEQVRQGQAQQIETDIGLLQAQGTDGRWQFALSAHDDCLVLVLHGDEDDAGRLRALRHVEENLHLNQKMNAIGRLAGGMAHEYNNMLMAILGHCERALKRVEPESPVTRSLQNIRKAGERAADFTRQLLTISRRDQSGAPQQSDLNDVIAGMDRVVRSAMGEAVEVDVDVDDARAWVPLPHSKAEQLLLNLILNARDAMPNGGMLGLRTRNLVLGGKSAAEHELPPGRYTQLSVEDTGEGMHSATMKRAFEPFFSTKGRKGAGLGLSIVYGIVKQANGHIEIVSAPGRGTSCTVLLPASEAPVADVGGAPPAKRRPRSRKVLVVEDEPMVLSWVVEVLQDAGYEVVAYTDPRTALQHFREQHDGIGLVLSDVVMPGMSGWTLAREIRRLREDTQVLYMSGYSQDRLSEVEDPDAGACLLQKPLKADELLDAVRVAVDGTPR